MTDNSDQRFKRYMTYILGAAAVVILLLWAANMGARDGAEHRVEDAATAG